MATAKRRRRSPNGKVKKAITVNLGQDHCDYLDSICEEYDISKAYAFELLLDCFDEVAFESALATEQVFSNVKKMSPEQIEKLKDLVQSL